MGLSQAESDDFMLAEKVVSGSQPMKWHQPKPGGMANWRGPIEIEAARVGEMILLVNPALSRSWCFKLSYRGEDVYRLDVRDRLSRHTNPRNRPLSFPAKLTDTVHEHLFVEGLDCKCAQPVEGLESSGHDAIFEWFCIRTHVRCEPPYTPLSIPYQMPML